MVLDDLVDIWNSDSTKLNCDQEYFVNSIGVAFGQHLVKTYGMKWEIVVDEYGSDLSTTVNELKLANYPIISVFKAIDQKRKGSLATISLLTKSNISKLRTEKQ